MAVTSLAAAWVSSVWLAGVLVERELERFATESGLRLDATSRRSWVPGRVVLRDVTLETRSGDFSLRAGSIELHVVLSSLLSHELELGLLTLGDVELDLGADVATPPAAARRPDAASAAAMRSAAAVASPTWGVRVGRGSLELRRLNLAGSRLSGRVTVRLDGLTIADGRVSGRLVLEGDGALSSNAGTRTRLSAKQGTNAELGVRDDRSLDVRLVAAEVRLRHGDWAIAFHEARATANGAATGAEPTGSVSLVSPHATLAHGSSSFDFELDAQAAISELHPASFGVRFGDGRVKAHLLASTKGGPWGDLRLGVRVDRGSLSLRSGASVVGALHVAGDDGGSLLEVLGLPGSIELALSSLSGRPFDVRARIDRTPRRFSITHLVAESPALRVEGALVRVRGVQRLALLVHRGRMAMGVAVGPNGARLEPMPERGWLARETAKLRRGMTPRGHGRAEGVSAR